MTRRRRKMQKRQRKIPVWIFLGLVLVLAVIIFGINQLFGRDFNIEKELALPMDYQPQSLTVPEDVRLAMPPENVLKEKLRIPIVMYHYVEYVKDPEDKERRSLSVRPDVFERQLSILKEASYESYFVRDVPKILDGTIADYDENNSIILSFDDGYADFYYDVFPLLKKYNTKATEYVIYNYIGRKGFLTKSQIKELVASGLVEIGSHTLDHAYLKDMPKDKAFDQISEAKKLLEKDYGISVESFAYPYGAFSQETVNFTRQASYKAAVSVIPGVLQNEANLFFLSRIRAGALTGPNMINVLEGITK